LVEESTESDKGNKPLRKKESISQKKFRLYMVPWKTRLTIAQEEIADRMARKAQQGSALFVKILAKIHSILVCMIFFFQYLLLLKILKEKEKGRI
jgi:hypothetical protein